MRKIITELDDLSQEITKHAEIIRILWVFPIGVVFLMAAILAFIQLPLMILAIPLLVVRNLLSIRYSRFSTYRCPVRGGLIVFIPSVDYFVKY